MSRNQHELAQGQNSEQRDARRARMRAVNMRRPRRRNTAALALLLIACISLVMPGCGGGGAAVQSLDIAAQGPTSIDAGQMLVLMASLGNGAARRAAGGPRVPAATESLSVTWAIKSGPGSLTNETSTSATFNADPNATAQETTIVTATSTTNSNQMQSITITTNPRPTVNPTSLSLSPAATEFTNATYTLTALGGSGNLTWALAGGSAAPAGMTLNSNGTLTGAPTGPAGQATFKVMVTDSGNPPVTSPAATATLTVNLPPAPIITPASFPNAPEGSVYNQTVTVSQGHGPYTLALSGTLPTTLGLTDAINNAAGTLTITGTPTAAAGTTAKFTLTVTDSSNPAQVVPFNLSIMVTPAPPLTFPSATLPAATDGSAYSPQTLTASGGVPPYTYNVAGGALPNGMTGTQSGNSFVVSGTPNDAPSKTYTLMVTVTDHSNPPQTTPAATLSIMLNPAPPVTLSPSNTTLTASENMPYSQAIVASGGIPPYKFTITNNTLPNTLQITPGNGPGSGTNNATETISGTPTATETGDMVTIQVSDSSLPTTLTAQLTYTLNVQATSPLAITTTSPLTGANLNEAYSTSVTATGGVPPYTWSFAAGSTFPPGFTASSLTSGTPSATLSGTPTGTGTFKFTIDVTDSAKTVVSATFLLTITGSSTLNCPAVVNLTVCGTYLYGVRGFNAKGGPTAFGGVVSVNNSGIVISGEQVKNDSVTNLTTTTITGGSVTMDASGDGRGQLTLIDSTAASASFRFTLESAANPGPGPIVQFDNSGDIVEGLFDGPETTPPPPLPANSVISLALDGVNGSGQIAAMLASFQVGSGGCNGSAGSLNSLGNFVTNTAGTVNTTLTATGMCTAPDANGVGTLQFTISGGTPFTNSTLHFTYIATGSSGTFTAAILLGTDALADNQPILTGLGTQNTNVGAVSGSAFASLCPCLFQSIGTTDGTVTTGKPDASITRIVVTASAGNSGSVSGVIDENAGGTITNQGAWPYTGFTVDTNGTGTITATGQKTIHFILGDVLYTLDESAQVRTGQMNGQNATAIQNPGMPYIFGADEATVNKALNVPRVSGVVTPSAGTSGSLSGTVDVVDTAGTIPGAAVTGNYNITGSGTTAGRGTGSASFTGGSAVNIVFYAFRGRRFLILDVQSSTPLLTGARLQ